MPSATVRIVLSCPHRTASSKLKVSLSTESTSNDYVRRYFFGRKIGIVPDIGLRWQVLVEDSARRTPKRRLRSL